MLLYNSEHLSAPIEVLVRTFAIGARYDSLVIASALLVGILAHAIIEKLLGKKLSDRLVMAFGFAALSTYILFLSTEAPYYKVFHTKLNLWTIIATEDQDFLTLLQTTWGMDQVKPFMIFQAAFVVIAFACLASAKLRSFLTIRKSPRWFVLQFLPLLALSFVYWPDPLWRHKWAGEQTTEMNQLGLNTIYGIAVNAAQNRKNRSINTFVPDHELEGEYSKIYRSTASANLDKLPGIERKTDSQPNIVFIVMEYMGAEFLDAWTPDGPRAAPFMSELASDSLMFDNIYSTAMRTQHGFVGTVSSFPSILTLSIARNRMGNKIPTIATFLPEYKSSFICGGEANYDNMDAFALQGDFQEVLDQRHFQEKKEIFKDKLLWGYSDEDVYTYLNESLKEESKTGKPLLKFVLTTSAHEPYDLPKEFNLRARGIQPKTPEAGIAYADHALGEFFKKAKKEAYYENTIFVMIADHSRFLSKPSTEIKRFHIPLLIHSPLLKHLNGRYDAIGGHIDVIPTLLGLLGRSSGPQPAFGHNLLDPNTTKVAFSRDADNLYMIEGRKSLEWNTQTGKTNLFELDRYSLASTPQMDPTELEHEKKRMLHASKVFLQRVGKKLNTGISGQAISHH